MMMSCLSSWAFIRLGIEIGVRNCLYDSHIKVTDIFFERQGPFSFSFLIGLFTMCVSFSCTTKWISYMYTHIPSLLELPPNPPPHPTCLGCHRGLGWAACAIQHLPTSYLFYTWQHTVNPNLPFIPLPLSLSPKLHSLSLCLYFCFTNRFTCIIFLDSTYTHQCMIFASLFLSYYTLYHRFTSLQMSYYTLYHRFTSLQMSYYTLYHRFTSLPQFCFF